MLLNSGKHLESMPQPAHKGDVESHHEPTALQKFSNKVLGEQSLASIEQKNEKAPLEEGAAAKLFLGRLSEISLNAYKGSETMPKAQAAWERMFNPAGFGQTSQNEAKAHDALCLTAKIYGDKA